MKTISRSEAKALGLKRYFTGTLCSHGHSSERLTRSGHCMECDRARHAKSYTTNRQRNIARAGRWQKENRERRLQITRKWRKENPEKVAADRIAYRAENREVLRQKNREYYKSNREDRLAYYTSYRINNPDKRKLSCRKWLEANPDKERAKNARHMAAKRQAVPSWLTRKHKREITTFYALAITHERLTGIPHHVDHIQPLQGKDRRGLHVPWNLQVLPGRANQSKGNRTS